MHLVNLVKGKNWRFTRTCKCKNALRTLLLHCKSGSNRQRKRDRHFASASHRDAKLHHLSPPRQNFLSFFLLHTATPRFPCTAAWCASVDPLLISSGRSPFPRVTGGGQHCQGVPRARRRASSGRNRAPPSGLAGAQATSAAATSRARPPCASSLPPLVLAAALDPDFLRARDLPVSTSFGAGRHLSGCPTTTLTTSAAASSLPRRPMHLPATAFS
jgi:hypothetical protein